MSAALRCKQPTASSTTAKVSPLAAYFTQGGLWPKPLWFPPTYLVVDKLLKTLERQRASLLHRENVLNHSRLIGSSLCLTVSASFSLFSASLSHRADLVVIRH